MKKKYILFSMIVMVFGLCTRCNNAEYETKDNSIYILEAVAAKSARVSFDETNGADVNLVIRLAKPVQEDVEIRISIDPYALARYNETYNTTLAPVSIENTDLEADERITIKAGEVLASKKIHINYFESQGKRYALPVAVEGLTGNITASVSQSKFIYIVAKKLFVRTPILRYKSGPSAIAAKPILETGADGAKTGGWNLYLQAYTIEFWARLDMYNTQNYSILAIYGNDFEDSDNYNCYFRFGDANTGPSQPNGNRNYINWKVWGAQLTGPFELVANQWNHWALIYDGTNLTIYRNGEEYLKTAAKYPGGTWVMHDVQLIGSHKAVNNNMNLSQVRIWKKALTPAQIKDNMYYEADASDPDLEAYWKMDEGPYNFNNIFIDATGHGHDAIFRPNSVTGFGWTEPQKFDK
ncbi:MAG: DUF1735 and LamG domain-containing protein [Prevotellaceae bacterium]|jgi:hypothetical protein|nr:DUF1735 and LamG domain-containing protein [Prevotellaceae bacterium]